MALSPRKWGDKEEKPRDRAQLVGAKQLVGSKVCWMSFLVEDFG